MRTTWAAAIAVLLLVGTSGWTKDDERGAKEPATNETPAKEAKEEGKSKGPSVWMKVKLRSTQQILRGLSLGDFDLIEENAARMNRFGHLERVAHGRDAAYQTQYKFFSHANEALVRQAKEKNLDGATLAFVQLTTSCVNCHRTIRDGESDAATRQHAWTHLVKSETEYYLTGPQQARPAEGKLAKGAKVKLIKDSGSYSQVRTQDDKTVYVATDALISIKKEAPKSSKE